MWIEGWPWENQYPTSWDNLTAPSSLGSECMHKKENILTSYSSPMDNPQNSCHPYNPYKSMPFSLFWKQLCLYECVFSSSSQMGLKTVPLLKIFLGSYDYRTWYQLYCCMSSSCVQPSLTVLLLVFRHCPDSVPFSYIWFKRQIIHLAFSLTLNVCPSLVCFWNAFPSHSV